MRKPTRRILTDEDVEMIEATKRRREFMRNYMRKYRAKQKAEKKK